ncbi:MAG: choice-of-anchor D domain-containing protein, partial [Planctomycetota bacterium]
MRLVFLAQLFLLTLLSSVHGQTFSVGIESPATVAGTGATRSFTARATLRLESVPEGLGVQAWSIGLRANGAQITGASVDDTVAADRGVNPEGLREEGFEFTELTSGPDNEGVVSAVVLSFTRPNKLPEDVDNYVLDVELEAPAPASGCETVSLEYAEGLRGTGEPVEVKVILEGDSYRPQSSGSETQVCSFPEAELSSESLSFAPLIVGESNTQNVELRNVGPAPLSVSTVSVEGAAFSLAADYDGSELASGAAIELDVGFSPTEVTDYSGTLQVVSNDPSNPILAIPLDGSGVPRPVPSIEIEPSIVDFGKIVVDRDKMEYVLFWNRGDARRGIYRRANV